ncbi:MAG: type II toxin-antitoxin system RelE/ParE family toxin [Gammaproteobacteria bacterium]
MIKSFGKRNTEALYEGTCPAAFRAFRKAAERKLQMIDSASALVDLRSPPGNRLEKLARDRTGQYSIRINDQWRICFKWQDGDAYQVEIVDYH